MEVNKRGSWEESRKTTGKNIGKDRGEENIVGNRTRRNSNALSVRNPVSNVTFDRGNWRMRGFETTGSFPNVVRGNGRSKGVCHAMSNPDGLSVEEFFVQAVEMDASADGLCRWVQRFAVGR